MPQYVNVAGVATLVGGDATIYAPDYLPDGLDYATSRRLAFTVNSDAATPHALTGAFVEVEPSLSADCGGIEVVLEVATSIPTGDSSMMLVVYTGAASSEAEWARITCGNLGLSSFFVPGFIAAGTRVSVRLQSVALADSITAAFCFFPHAPTTIGAPQVMGNVNATSRGVSLNTSGSAHTMGAWTEIDASTSADITALAVSIQADGDTTISGSTYSLVDIAVGAAASEVTIISGVSILWSSTEQITSRSRNVFAVDIPAGSRISARWQRNTTNLAGLDVMLVGA